MLHLWSHRSPYDSEYHFGWDMHLDTNDNSYIIFKYQLKIMMRFASTTFQMRPAIQP